LLKLKGSVHRPPRGEGNAQAIQTAFLRRFADDTAAYLRVIETEFGVTIRRIALDAPSGPKSDGCDERECEKALRKLGVSYISTPSRAEFDAVRRKVEQHLAAGGSEARIPHANQLWMLVGFALFVRLRETWDCIEVFPQATAHATGAASLHKSKPGGVQRQLDAAARYTRASGKMAVSELDAACFGTLDDRSDAFLSAWVASLDEHECEPLGPPGPDAIWIPKLSACKEFVGDQNSGDSASLPPAREGRPFSDQRNSTDQPKAGSTAPRPQPVSGAGQAARETPMPDEHRMERGVRLFTYLVEAANRGESVGISYGSFVAYLHAAKNFPAAAGRPFLPSDAMAAVRIAWRVTDAAKGRREIARSGTAIHAGMDTFIWNAKRPYDRPDGAWKYPIPYTREQWRSVFPEGARRLITPEELMRVAVDRS
jgi:hypothetical protein